jgi:hypothetical protein
MVYLLMVNEFRELVNVLMLQGWRVYYNNALSIAQSSRLELLANKKMVEIRVYEGKPFIFVRTILPKTGEKRIKNDKNQ